MSTLDSTINALCATVYNDILPKTGHRNIRATSFAYTLGITVLLFLIAVVASKNDGLLMLGLRIQSWTGGTLLGLFLATVVLRPWFRVPLDTWSVVGAYAFGTLGVYTNQLLGWDWNLNVYWGCGMALLFLKIYARVVRPSARESR
jgi:hypothetical protein